MISKFNIVDGSYDLQYCNMSTYSTFTLLSSKMICVCQSLSIFSVQRNKGEKLFSDVNNYF